MSYRAEAQSWVETRDAYRLMRNVYVWMTLALAVTGLTAWYVYSSGMIWDILSANENMFFFLIIAQVGLVFAFSSVSRSANVALSAILFTVYALVNGLCFSVYFLLFTDASIASVFFISAAVFASASVYAVVTKKALDGIGQYLMLGLIGIIIASIVNMFLQSDSLYYIISYIGVVVFTGLTAYDTQKLKRASEQATHIPEDAFVSLSLRFALSLYLDFINLFIMLLRIMGRRR